MKLSLYILYLMLFTSCNFIAAPELLEIEDAVSIETVPGQSPYLTLDPKGNIYLAWVNTISDSSAAFCYSKTRDGKTFSNPVLIPGSSNVQPHGENLPKIIVKPSGEIIALWGVANPNARNKYSGKVFYAQSFDDGNSWSKARPLVDDTAGFDQRYYDVDLLPNGEAAIIWLDNRKTLDNEGSALYYSTTAGKNGFQNEKLIAESCCPCCRTDLYVDQQAGVHIVFRGIIRDSIRDMVHMVSLDGGNSFSLPKRISEDNWVISGCPHTGPAITGNSKGLHFAWYTGGKKPGTFYSRSSDNGKNFIDHDYVSPQGTHPQMTALEKGDILLAWEESNLKENKVYKSIGIERRTAAGMVLRKEFIHSGKGNISFPVVVPFGNHSVLLAYTNKQEGKSFISTHLIHCP